MKKSIFIPFMIAALWTVAPVRANAMDVEQYVEIGEKSLKSIKRGKVKDVEKILAQQRELIRLGIEGCLEFAEKSPADAKMMHLVVLNSQRMRNLPLDQFQKEWLEGGYLRGHGIDIDKFSGRDQQTTYYNAVVRPAGAIVAVQEYHKSKDAALLESLHKQLSEAVDSVESLR